MTLASFLSACLSLCLLAALAAAQDLPVKGKPEDLEAEAQHLINDLPSLTDPDTTASDTQTLPLDKAKARLVQAQRKMQRWEKLLKDGVLSQSEVERCTIELADALDRYQHANLEELRRQLAAAQKRVSAGTADQALVDAANAGIQSAQVTTEKADAQLFQTKFDLAKINLERQRKLFAEKLISRASLQEAEALVQRLADQKAVKP